MGTDREGTRRILEQAEQFASAYEFDITDDYRRLIASVESMPYNQSGGRKDGSWLGTPPLAQTTVTDASLERR